MSFNSSSGSVVLSGTVVSTANQSNASTGQQTTSSTTARTDSYTVGAGKYWIIHSISFERDKSGYVGVTVDGVTLFTVYPADIAASSAAQTYVFPIMGYRLATTKAIVFTFSVGTSATMTSAILYTEYNA